MSEEDVQTIIIDNGSGTCKAGFSSDETPRSVFPSVVGRPKYKQQLLGGKAKDVYVGDEAYAKAGILILRHPVERGITNNWDDMEKIWHHAFYNELRVDPTEHPVLLTEASLTPKANREKMIALMFDTFEVPSFYVVNQAVSSLLSSGRTTGIVLESGHGVSQIVPIYETYSIKHAIKILNIAGCDLNDWMEKLLRERNYVFQSTAEKEIIHDIKEKLCYVALDYDEEMEKAATSSEINRTYELPDGNILKVGNERFRCPELLFKPYFDGIEHDGIDKTLFDSISMCDIDIRRDLYTNIILSGGTSKLEGLSERIEKEMISYAPPSYRVRVIRPRCEYITWYGCSTLSSLSFFNDIVITKEEYDENGPRIVHQKCF